MFNRIFKQESPISTEIPIGAILYPAIADATTLGGTAPLQTSLKMHHAV